MKTVVAALTTLTLAGFAVSAEASWPGSNGSIAVFAGHTDRTSFSGELRLVHLSGATPGTAGGCVQSEDAPLVAQLCPRSPDYSRDGRTIVVSLSGGRLAFISATGRRELQGLTDADDGPAWGPDGRVVFTGRRNGRRNLFIVNADGTGLRQLTFSGGRSAAWSVRDRIAYVRRGRIYTIDPDGTDKRLVRKGDNPNWSPNGRRLVYDRNGKIAIVRLSTGKRRKLPGRGEQPVFSPDGTRIAYVSPPGDAESDLFIREIASGDRRKLFDADSAPASGDAFNFAEGPSWQPLP